MPCQAETIQPRLPLSQGTSCWLLSYAVGGGGWASLGAGGVNIYKQCLGCVRDGCSLWAGGRVLVVGGRAVRWIM